MTRIVVFDIDGLSIRSAGCFGNVETPTPLLNEFAAQAMVFEQHYRSCTGAADDLASAMASFPQSIPVSHLCLDAICGENAGPPTARFGTIDQLAELLEQHLEPESVAVWVRLAARDGTLDSAVPLPLISALVEQRVQVAITSTSPATDPVIQDEAAIRVPLMVWTGEPSRVQTVTSTARLGDILGLTGEDDDESEFAVIQSIGRVAMRESEGLLIVSRSLLIELSEVSDERLAEHIDMTGEQLQLFRKPEDVWNVHSVLVEEPTRGVAALSRLRKLLPAL